MTKKFFIFLQAVIKCMSVQFDVVVKDRLLILHKLSQLQNAMPRRQVLSWSFFIGRLLQLFLEADIRENTESMTMKGLVLCFSVGRVFMYVLSVCISDVVEARRG